MTFAFLYLFCICVWTPGSHSTCVGISSLFPQWGSLFPPWSSRDQKWSGLYLLSSHANQVSWLLWSLLLKWLWVFGLHVCLCTACMSGIHAGQKRGSDLLEWGLEVVMSHHVGSGSFARTAILGHVVPFLRPSSLKCYKSEGGGWLFKWSLFPVYPFSWFWYFWLLCHFFLKY